ncbi:MAG: triose-phosphate isomerase [Chitinivibrionales bacterium]|nr:triose-phosphate isomerase [Chitinivibrionales bacterium]
MARKKFIAGNWKMHTTLSEGVALAHSVIRSVGSATDVDVALCPPYISLSAIAEALKGSMVKLGAQDVHWEEKGAFTGKISCSMLASVGVTYVIIGHSEQRTYFYETDETVNKKLKTVFVAQLLPILCIGETLQQRNNGSMEMVLETQIRKAFTGIQPQQARTCTIAYEPVWAIGTGVNATPQQANDAHVFVRKIIAQVYTPEIASTIRILYGGSLKPENAKEILAQSDVDGGLIGGASLKVESFMGIVNPR